MFQLLLAIVVALGRAPSDTKDEGACIIRGARAALEVSRPRDALSRETLWLEGRATASLTGDGEMVQVEFLSPIAMRATLPRSSLTLRMRRPMQFLQGRLTLGPGFRLEPLFAIDNRVSVHVPLRGSISFPLLEEGGREPSLIAECDSVELSSPFRPEARPISTLRSRVGAFVQRDGHALALFPTIDSDLPPLMVDSGLEWERLAVRGPWAQVRARWTDGTFLRGWTNSPLERTTDDFTGDGSGGCGNSEMEGGFRALATKGGGIYSSLMDTPWATFPVDTPVMVVESVPGWYVVYHIPGIFRIGCGGRFDQFPIGRMKATDLRRMKPFPYPVHIPQSMRDSL